MMQLLCNGEYLDLGDNTSLSLKKSNHIFAFDKLTCDRSTEFSIPATPTNNRVLSVAKNAAFYGIGMRRRFVAQLIDGVCVMNGFLYVASYDKGYYKAIFLTGDMLPLKMVKDAGKLADYADIDIIHQVDGTPYPANRTNDGYTYEPMNYRQGNTQADIVPSISTKYLLTKCSEVLGISIEVPDICNYLRIVPPKAFGMSKARIEFVNTAYHPGPTTDDDPTDPTNTLKTQNALLETDYIPLRCYATAPQRPAYLKEWSYLAGCIHTLQDVTIKFPADFPSDLYLLKINSETTWEFLGGYAFSKPYVNADETYDNETGECTTSDTAQRTGTPLGGKSVDIPSGSRIMFVTVYDYVHAGDENWEYIYEGWSFNQRDFSFIAEVEGESGEIGGTYIRLVDNLPDINLVELLKTIANLTGRVLNYSDADGITFDDIDSETLDTIDLTGKVIEYGQLTRNFNDYAKRNYVRFKSDALVADVDSPKAVYLIDNDSLEEESTIYELPFSPASFIDEDGETRAYVDNEYEQQDEFMLMLLNGDGGDTYMHRADIPTVGVVSELCAKSTTIIAKLHMSLYEYQQVKAKQLIIMDGIRYVWMESTWSKGVATLTLAKY